MLLHVVFISGHHYYPQALHFCGIQQEPEITFEHQEKNHISLSYCASVFNYSIYILFLCSPHIYFHVQLLCKEQQVDKYRFHACCLSYVYNVCNCCCCCKYFSSFYFEINKKKSCSLVKNFFKSDAQPTRYSNRLNLC